MCGIRSNKNRTRLKGINLMEKSDKELLKEILEEIKVLKVKRQEDKDYVQLCELFEKAMQYVDRRVGRTGFGGAAKPDEPTDLGIKI